MVVGGGHRVVGQKKRNFHITGDAAPMTTVISMFTSHCPLSLCSLWFFTQPAACATLIPDLSATHRPFSSLLLASSELSKFLFLVGKKLPILLLMTDSFGEGSHSRVVEGCK